MNKSFGRRLLLTGLVVAVTVVVGLPGAADSATSASSRLNDGPKCDRRIFNVVAHADDDLLFLSPDLLHSIRSGDCVKTIYLTADDAGDGVERMLEKEAGGRSAYAWMKGVADSWTEEVTDHTVHWFLGDGPVEIVSLRLPDGGHGSGNPEQPLEGPYDQPGYAIHEHQTIAKLWLGEIHEISNITATASFTFDELVHTLLGEMADFRPTEIRTQDKRSSEGDHPDHACGALFAWEAIQHYANAHKLTEYRDYNIEDEPENLTEQDSLDKSKAFFTYAAHDYEVCQNQEQCEGTPYGRWLHRQYIYHQEG
jgi:hypothetical protein